MGKILIAISGPKHGGKTTLANKIMASDALAYRDWKHFEFSDILEAMIKPLRIQGGKELRRPYLIAVGEALESMGQPVRPLLSAMLQQLDSYDLIYRLQIVSGVGRVSELAGLRQYAYTTKRHFLHIHQSMYASDSVNQTAPGEQYPNDCRVNLMDFAHMWNPQMELIEKKLATLLDMEYWVTPS